MYLGKAEQFFLPNLQIFATSRLFHKYVLFSIFGPKNLYLANLKKENYFDDLRLRSPFFLLIIIGSKKKCSIPMFIFTYICEPEINRCNIQLKNKVYYKNTVNYLLHHYNHGNEITANLNIG